MIPRGTNHYILSRMEILQRIRDPSTLDLLESLMWYYDTWSGLNLMRSRGGTTIAFDQRDEFKNLMKSTKEWLGNLDEDSGTQSVELEIKVRPTKRKALRTTLF